MRFVPWLLEGLKVLAILVLAGIVVQFFRLATDLAITVVIAMLGLILAWQAFDKSAPLSQQVGFAAVSVALGCFLVWQGYRNGPIKTLSFKESAFLTPYRKLAISHDVFEFKAYLEAIGLEVPSTIPVVEVVTRAKGGSIGASFSTQETGTTRVELSTMRILDSHLRDRKAATSAYAGYLEVRSMYPPGRPNRTPMPPVGNDEKAKLDWIEQDLRTSHDHPEDHWRTVAIMASIMYLVDSYWGARGEGGLPPWTDVFWGIRKKCGKQFADRLTAALLNKLAVDFQGGWTGKEQYVRAHLQQADAQIDSEAAQWPEIQEILRGVDAPPKEKR